MQPEALSTTEPSTESPNSNINVSASKESVNGGSRVFSLRSGIEMLTVDLQGNHNLAQKVALLKMAMLTTTHPPRPTNPGRMCAELVVDPLPDWNT